MATWTNKQWGALIGALVVFSIALVGWGDTAMVVIFGVIGYYVGKYLDGEIDLQDIRDRAQGRSRGTPEATDEFAPRRVPPR